MVDFEGLCVFIETKRLRRGSYYNKKSKLRNPKVAKKINLMISGMTCNGCAASVESALQNVAGVDRAIVNLDSGVAVVDLGNDELGPASLIVAVKLAGYDARVIE
jgi:copper chaperone CopZ